jgi:HAD superfamily hydrolase (TIGR01549 family)
LIIKVFTDIKLVIFDKDGTIFDLHKYWAFVIKQRAIFFSKKYKHSSFLNLLDELTKLMGLVDENYISKKGPIGIHPRSHIVDIVHNKLNSYEFKIERKDVEEGFINVDEIVDKNLNNLVEKLPGVDYLLSRLKNLGCYIALATTDISQRTSKTLNYAGIDRSFDYLISSDQVKKSKPNSEMIEKIILNFKDIRHSQVLLIGDSIADVNLAKNAGIRFIGVKTGTNADDFLDASDILIENLSDIIVESQ